MDLLHIFNLSCSFYCFPSIYQSSIIISIPEMGNLSTHLLIFCFLKLFERIILFRQLFFLESNSVLSPRKAVFRRSPSNLNQIVFIFQSSSGGLTNSSRAFGQFFPPVIFPRLSILSGHSLLSTSLFLPASFLDVFDGLDLFFGQDPCLTFQNQKNCSFRVLRNVL